MKIVIRRLHLGAKIYVLALSTLPHTPPPSPLFAKQTIHPLRCMTSDTVLISCLTSPKPRQVCIFEKCYAYFTRGRRHVVLVVVAVLSRNSTPHPVTLKLPRVTSDLTKQLLSARSTGRMSSTGPPWLCSRNRCFTGEHHALPGNASTPLPASSVYSYKRGAGASLPVDGAPAACRTHQRARSASRRPRLRVLPAQPGPRHYYLHRTVGYGSRVIVCRRRCYHM